MEYDVVEAHFLLAAQGAASLPPPMLAEIAFGGRSNVGKSSLMNLLMQRRSLVRTSSTPGATRGLNFFRATLRSGVTMDLVDLPGYGYAKRSKSERVAWGALVEGFLKKRSGLRAVVVIVDARRGLEDDDRELLEFLEHAKRTPVLVATKLDKVPRSKRAAVLKDIGKAAGRRVIGTSATDGAGREELWRELLRASGLGAQSGGGGAGRDATASIATRPAGEGGSSVGGGSGAR